MPFMIQIKNKLLLPFILLFALSTNINSQTNNLTGSPYSLFGLGVEGNSNIGKSSGMGYTGISLDASEEINFLNPASFATIKEKKFIFDIGFYTQIESLNNGENNELRHVTNFSNFAIGFNANGKYGLGLSLLPSSNVGYTLVGIESIIEGSNNESYSTNITGSGSLNDLRIDYGQPLLENLNVGLRFSYLFGKIEETESVQTTTSLLAIEKDNYYSGVRFGFGAQYTFLEKNTIGLTIESPTSLSASRDTTTSKITESALTTIEETTNENIANFKLPLKLGLGISKKYKYFNFALDFKKSFWNSTNQSDETGDYVDQNIINFGTEFIKDPTSYKYWERINYRAGFNYDSGYLKVDNKNISSSSFSLGLGFPLDFNGSKLNLSYGYKKTGNIDGILIQENIHTININLSLTDLWFIKRKYN